MLQNKKEMERKNVYKFVLEVIVFQCNSIKSHIFQVGVAKM